MERSEDRHRADRIDGLVCDLDGVVYLGDRPIEGAADAIAALRKRGVRLVFCTNNSRFTVAQYVDKLVRLGVDAAPEEIVTSAVVTGEVLAARGLRGTRAIVIGGDGIAEELGRAGIEVEDSRSTTADLVVVGWDPSFTYDSMRRASLAVRAGAKLVATNEDAAFPAPGTQGDAVVLWPGAGAILASIERATGARAEVMGKPHEPMMEAVARRLAGAVDVAMVGDRPETDLAGGAARGWTTILVLTGVTRAEDAPTVTPAPDLILPSLAALAV